MGRKKSQNTCKYFCKPCNYDTNNKYDWNKHILTMKHLKHNPNNENCSSINATDQTLSVAKPKDKDFICEHCNKIYKYKSGLSRHKKNCQGGISKKTMKTKTEYLANPILQQQHEQIQNLQNILEKTIESQQDMFDNLIQKVGNTTNHINNRMTINVFLNEECKNAMNLTDFMNSLQLSLEDLQYTKENGYIKGITNIFVKNLQDMNPTERPIHCSDKKKLQFYVKDENQWQKDNQNKKIDRSIETITQKQIQNIKAWEKEHPNWNTTEHGTELYMGMVKEVMGGMSQHEKFKNRENIKKELGSTIDINNLLEDNNNNMLM